MTTIFSALSDSARKRRAYNRTVAELKSMSIETALDLDIYHGDIPTIARRAVYGK